MEVIAVIFVAKHWV